MNNADWIIYERSTRWVAALRTFLCREPASQARPRIFEARRLSDVSARLCARPASVVLLEVDSARLAAALEWLADSVPRCPTTCFAALLEPGLSRTLPDRQLVVDALLEAGVREAAISPRHLKSILALAQQHSKTAAAAATTAADVPLRDWAWARLPWQGDDRRVG